MIRIVGVNLDPKKQIRFAITPIKGVGKNNVKDILKALDIIPITKLGDITDEKLVELRNYIEKTYVTEADLRRQKQSDIKRLIDINCHRGLRHKANLPVRGQTTRTNSRTCRGNKRQMSNSGRPKSASKT